MHHAVHRGTARAATIASRLRVRHLSDSSDVQRPPGPPRRIDGRPTKAISRDIQSWEATPIVMPADARGDPTPIEFSLPNSDTLSIVRLLSIDGRRYRQWRLGINRPRTARLIKIATASSLADALEAYAPGFGSRRANAGELIATTLPSWVIAALPSRLAAGEDIYKLVRLLKQSLGVLDPIHAALCLARLLVTALRLQNVVMARALVEWFLAAPDAEALRLEPSAWEYMATAIVHAGRRGTGDTLAIRRELLARFVERVCAEDAEATGAVVAETLMFDICLATPVLLESEAKDALRSARRRRRRLDGAVDADEDDEKTEGAYERFTRRMHEADDDNDVLAVFQEARQHADGTKTTLPASVWIRGLQAASRLLHIPAEALIAAMNSFLGDPAYSRARPQQLNLGFMWADDGSPTRSSPDRQLVRALAARVLDGHAHERDATERRHAIVVPAVTAVINGLLNRGRKTAALHVWRDWIAGQPGADAATIALGARMLSQTIVDAATTGFELVSACAARPMFAVKAPAYAAVSPAMVQWLSEPDYVMALLPRLAAPIEMDATVLNSLLQQLARQSRLLDMWSLWTLAPSYWAGALYNAKGATAIVRSGMILSASLERLHRPPWLLRAVEHGLGLELKPSADGVEGESWGGAPAWRRAREVFWEIVVGNHPHLADAVRSPLQGVGYVNQALAWTGLGSVDDEATWRPASLDPFQQMGRLAQAPYPTILPDAELFHEFVSLAAVHGFVHEIPLALAWMRALGVVPRRATVLNALVMYENLAATDALEMAGWQRWIEDWLGADEVPTADEITAMLFGNDHYAQRNHCAL